ncbi:MAG: hypothetical protein V4616_01805 [Bacteroidota bacterium]
MASKINTLEDLHIEKMRVKILLKDQEDKLDQHYQFIAGKVRPFTGIIDAFGAFSGNGESGGSRSMWMGLVGTVLNMAMPLVIKKFMNNNVTQPTTWWGNILNTVGSFVDKDMIQKVVERVTGSKLEEEDDEDENKVADLEEGHA